MAQDNQAAASHSQLSSVLSDAIRSYNTAAQTPGADPQLQRNLANIAIDRHELATLVQLQKEIKTAYGSALARADCDAAEPALRQIEEELSNSALMPSGSAPAQTAPPPSSEAQQITKLYTDIRSDLGALEAYGSQFNWQVTVTDIQRQLDDLNSSYSTLRRNLSPTTNVQSEITSSLPSPNAQSSAQTNEHEALIASLSRYLDVESSLKDTNNSQATEDLTEDIISRSGRIIDAASLLSDTIPNGKARFGAGSSNPDLDQSDANKSIRALCGNKEQVTSFLAKHGIEPLPAGSQCASSTPPPAATATPNQPLVADNKVGAGIMSRLNGSNTLVLTSATDLSKSILLVQLETLQKKYPEDYTVTQDNNNFIVTLTNPEANHSELTTLGHSLASSVNSCLQAINQSLEEGVSAEKIARLPCLFPKEATPAPKSGLAR